MQSGAGQRLGVCTSRSRRVCVYSKYLICVYVWVSSATQRNATLAHLESKQEGVADTHGLLPLLNLTIPSVSSLFSCCPSSVCLSLLLSLHHRQLLFRPLDLPPPPRISISISPAAAAALGRGCCHPSSSICPHPLIHRTITTS